MSGVQLKKKCILWPDEATHTVIYSLSHEIDVHVNSIQMDISLVKKQDVWNMIPY
jgi:hypothetical protein